MEQDEFAEFVGRLTEDAARAPGSYRLRVFGVVVLGYLGVLGMLLLALLATFGVLALLFWIHALWFLKLAWIPALFGLIILKSLWIRLPPPRGVPLDASSAPELFGEIEAVCARMEVPRIHRVLATSEFNAGATQVPVLGLFGWYRSYLTLGLPLLQSLSREQFRAVLAHELAHLSRRHGRFANRVYAMRTTWMRVHAELDQVDHWGQALVRDFLEWYAPLLDAYGFVLARAHEYEADRAGVGLTSPEVAASALARIEVASRFAVEAYWQAVFERARSEPEPPRAVFADLGRALERPVEPQRAAAWLATARAQRTGWHDTHPSYSERLRGLDCEPASAVATAPPAGGSAAGLLGAALPELILEFDVEWWGQALHPWRVLHHEAEKARTRRAELQGRPAGDGITAGERAELVSIAGRLEGREAARAEAERLVADHPDFAPGRYLLGRLLLDAGDERGLACLDAAMDLDPEAIEPACTAAQAFLEARERATDAGRYAERLDRHRSLLRSAGEERKIVLTTDTFLPHTLSDEALDHVRSALRLNPEIGEAFLVRKPVKLLPETPHHVLGVVPHLPGFVLRRSERESALAEWLEERVPVPGTKAVVLLVSEWEALRPRLEEVPGSRVHSPDPR